MLIVYVQLRRWSLFGSNFNFPLFFSSFPYPHTSFVHISALCSADCLQCRTNSTIHRARHTVCRSLLNLCVAPEPHLPHHHPPATPRGGSFVCARGATDLIVQTMVLTKSCERNNTYHLESAHWLAHHHAHMLALIVKCQLACPCSACLHKKEGGDDAIAPPFPTPISSHTSRACTHLRLSPHNLSPWSGSSHPPRP